MNGPKSREETPKEGSDTGAGLADVATHNLVCAAAFATAKNALLGALRRDTNGRIVAIFGDLTPSQSFRRCNKRSCHPIGMAATQSREEMPTRGGAQPPSRRAPMPLQNGTSTEEINSGRCTFKRALRNCTSYGDGTTGIRAASGVRARSGLLRTPARGWHSVGFRREKGPRIAGRARRTSPPCAKKVAVP